ncbi:MAG: hypothetical protein IK038_03275 [Bacteroidaceae bacterium]|nr:hypothetical protein [Bacteroidaceae bacterium]
MISQQQFNRYMMARNPKELYLMITWERAKKCINEYWYGNISRGLNRGWNFPPSVATLLGTPNCTWATCENIYPHSYVDDRIFTLLQLRRNIHHG